MIKVLDVDEYLRDGCGRCDHFRTPACKVHRWARELVALRELVLEAGLVEEVKWGCPCYSLDGKNVLMVVAFKEHCALSFFKGALLVDDGGLLESAGPNSRHGRLLRFRSLDELVARRGVIRALIDQAAALERAGAKVAPTPQQSVPEELQRRLDADPALRRAFDALTPGRRRSHALHVAGAKQAETRERRVDRCAPVILAGRGFNE